MASTWEIRREVRAVVGWAAVAALLTAGHFAYGARLYGEPGRNHVLVPIAVAFALTLGAASASAAWPSTFTRWLLALAAGVPFVVVFGVFHGGYLHLGKLLAFAVGVSPERLLELFDTPDFAMPNDIGFELSGAAGFFVALHVTIALLRVLRSGRGRPEAAGASEVSPS